ncbi:tripartite tricarboxylate transporter substrate binding protein [Jiella pacifica]|uniref:Tripartite tricarboxylate transporter substrate binding protein n=1 Tax=Jiella pacifica TaxID=2696469 RepID=A0A6N9SZL5_9HYPH|nr:tripartite tricarboxylate transporter substrate binding protein [Jiella pacifica]NDW04540.1 tripartite tricarboxylate transporter substrate binding protein [Jiella pacifica]
MFTRRLFAGALALGATSLMLAPAFAQTSGGYPDKPINYIVVFNAGGASDLAARMQQKYFEAEIGVGAVVQYMPGGGGAQGWARLNSMEPDGYTIMGTNLPHNILQPMAADVGYETDDIATVNFFQYTPSIVVVPKDSQFKTLDDLIAYAKENPGSLTFSGSGSNSGDQVMKERFDQVAEVVTTYIPFSGTSPATAALLGNQVQASVTYTTEGVNQGDQLRVLAVAADERLPALPDAPTFKELGYDLVGGAYRGVAVPNGTPEERRQEVSGMISKISQNAEFKQEMEQAGFVPVDITYSEIPEFIAEQTEIYTSVAEPLGLIDK